jgi:3-phytase
MFTSMTTNCSPIREAFKVLLCGLRRLLAAFLWMLLCISMANAQTTITIPAKATTSATGNDVDDCAIWVNPTDPAKSLVVVNDKGLLTGKGGLYIYNLNGVQIQKVPIQQPQNPDIRYNVVLGNDTMDVLACVDRQAGNTSYNRVRVFKIDSSKAAASSGFLTEITTSAGIPTGQNEAYGHGLYLRPSDGALFSIVTGYTNVDFTQIKLESDGEGKVKGAIVRKWGGSDIMGDECEGTCADDELGFIYICDENDRILKYYADPDKNKNTLVETFAENDGIVSDREGINIYRCDNNTGYVLVSSQGNNEIKVYDRVTNEFKGTVNPEGMKDCDGLDVTAVPLGAQFPHGMAAFHLGTTAGSQFSFYDWSDIATGLSLATPCDAKRPHKPYSNSIRASLTASTSDSRQSSTIRFLYNKSMIRIAPLMKGIVHIALYHLNGQLMRTIYNGSINDNEITIPINNLALRPGAYLIKFSTNNLIISEKTVILR